jgi:uncharacterized protein YfaS (alpha-2-macroglobulin family)
VHLPLNREDRKAKVALTVPAKTQPSVPLPITVKAPSLAGKPAIVTVSAVDVGILNITNFKTPDPQDFFFGKHRYGADMLDLYGRLIEKMDGNMAKQRFGGDAGKRDSQSMPRKVLLVDLFSGPVQLDAKGEATVNLKLPDFNGTLRVMAVVSSADSYGSAQAETVVAAPLVAELNMPRFVSPGDKATIALDVTNLSGAPQTVKVAVTASGPVKITAAPSRSSSPTSSARSCASRPRRWTPGAWRPSRSRSARAPEPHARGRAAGAARHAAGAREPPHPAGARRHAGAGQDAARRLLGRLGGRR